MLNMTAAAHYYYPYYVLGHFFYRFEEKLPAAELPAAALAAAAVEALLRLLLKLCNRPHIQGAVLCLAGDAVDARMVMCWGHLCSVPGTVQLPAAARCELAELALQDAPTWVVAPAASLLLHPLVAAGVALPDTHIRRLLALLKGQLGLQVAAAAARQEAAEQQGYKRFVNDHILMWLVRQPGAAAAAADIGVTAADVADARVRDALFGQPGPAGML
jgi:hypothetical protein